MSQSAPGSDLSAAQSRLMEAVIPLARNTGFNRMSLMAGAHAIGASEAEIDLLCPNGASDIVALIWRRHDEVIETVPVDGLRIREKIDALINGRLDAGAEDEALAHRMAGFLAMPHNIGLAKELVWKSADLIWRRAGDQALDENHYSKRAIVSGILTTAALTRLTRGYDAQREQVARNIESVMAFEKWKATQSFKPEQALSDAAAFLGRLRFGGAA